MESIQNKIKQFDDERDWGHHMHIKDLLLNMNEEIGEIWHIIKWVDYDTQFKMIQENKDEVENFVGDMLFLILKIAHICDVDSKKAIEDVLVEYEKRFPKEIVKGKHANLKAGGIDLKD